ncbi:MAG: CpXC domain-containing protein [Clostridia bacterium]|nr:CpXC domain-containing protein [Clostridia bacterium]
MEKEKIIRVTCPACLEEGNFRTVPFVDANLDSDLKESIFNRDIFRFCCKECGEEILVSYECTYLDKDNNFMVSLIPEKDDLVIEMTGYTLRIVRTINEFVEKIALMEDGIDDRVVELYKIMLEDQFEEERQGSEILGIYYSGQNPDDKSLVFFIITANAENVRAILSFDTYQTISKQFENYPEMDKNDCEINKIWAIKTLQNGFSDKTE